MSSINLKKNIMMGGSARLIIMILAFFSSWISARYLGVELKGQYSYLVTMGSFIWMVLDLGLYHSYPYLIRKSPGKVNNLFGWSVLTFLAETILLCAIGLILINFWSRALGFDFNPVYMLAFVALVTLRKFFMQMQSLYLGLDKIWLHSIGQLINSATFLLLILLGYLLLRGADRLAWVLGAVLIGLSASIMFFMCRHHWDLSFRKLDLGYVFSSYKFGIRVFISALLISLMIRADILLIRYFLDFSQVGIYSISAHVVDLLQAASNVVGGMLLVKLSDTADDLGKWIVMRKMLLLFFVFLTAANLGFLMLGRFVLAILYGAEFVPAYPVYLWLIPASYGLSFGSLFNNYLNSKGFPVITIVIAGLALAVNIGLNLLLIPLWGIKGAALTTSVSYLLWFILIIAWEQKQTGGKMLKHLVPDKGDWLEVRETLAQVLAKARQQLHRH
ncbi:MAG: polysaccharide biosynthesis C-terminal domain-containing protein [Candidatus Syntrophosphaera sp.]|nr:polysaccharide biosynthesis C-terminal domain-containing protein [Candidatus Syntrophosphaera sp.]